MPSSCRTATSTNGLAVLRPYLAKFERVAVVRSPAGNNLNRFRNVTAGQCPAHLVARFRLDSYPPDLPVGRHGRCD